MRPLVRIFILVLTAAVSILALKQWVYRPWWCMREIAAIGGDTLRADAMVSHAQAVVLARENLARARILEERCPTSVHVYPLVAANEQLLGRDEDAIRTYRRALAIARRPEIYFEIGHILVKLGRVDEALNEYVRGASFNRTMIDSIDDLVLREVVTRRVGPGQGFRGRKMISLPGTATRAMNR